MRVRVVWREAKEDAVWLVLARFGVDEGFVANVGLSLLTDQPIMT